ncbi:MAG TPA: lysophospholipid acyltransferase family protein [Flexivirga sp.]|uniref:lysophospholipid acyltransferase family protein n=1 Tax=Flexivirga sp. TaxID=1962927 RepID=UPI002B71A20F|nr:lysophospholipid acyltransferase family protein [Flexivirga sp.]HWC20741.1 lysophospholipid acyltransferase family protein [Flexivirga sp.]
MFYWLLKWVLLGPLLKGVFRPTVEGAQNVPERGPVILASNHLSVADWLFMPLVIPRRVTFVAKAEYFNTPGVKGRLQKAFFSGAGQVPIDRSSGTAAAGALETGLRILREGEVFGIYPEGTRSPDGRLYKGKTGLARIALESGAPVIPVGVIGTDVIAPQGKLFGRIVRPHVRFGAPIDFSRYEGMEDDRFVLRSITDEVMYEIMLLTGQEYVDVYAASLKKGGITKKAKEIGGGAAALATQAKDRLQHHKDDKDDKDGETDQADRAEDDAPADPGATENRTTAAADHADGAAKSQ